MKLVDQSVERLEQSSGLEGIYKQIELAGRTCYKSEDKITEDSAESFVQRMIDSGHTAMLEHGTVYMYLKHDMKDGVDMGDPYDISLDMILCKYGQHNSNFDTHEVFFTTNLRWLVERYPEDWKSIYEYYGCEPTDKHPKRVSFKCTTCIHVYKDLTRHRTMSFAIESTRFCNYSKGKYGSELTFVKPVWCGEADYTTDNAEAVLQSHLAMVEDAYLDLTKKGWKAEQAAEVLPQCTKADMVITGFESDWEHLFDLRYRGTTGNPHPLVKDLATKIYNAYEQQN